MFGAPSKAQAIQGKPDASRDESKEAINALIANLITFGVLVGMIRTVPFAIKQFS